MVTLAVPLPLITKLDCGVPTATLMSPVAGAVTVAGAEGPVLTSVTTKLWPLVACVDVPAAGVVAPSVEIGVTGGT